MPAVEVARMCAVGLQQAAASSFGQWPRLQACSAMVAGAPSSHVSTASAELFLQFACPAILYTDSGNGASMLRRQSNPPVKPGVLSTSLHTGCVCAYGLQVHRAA
jgi:hypothetical protein